MRADIEETYVDRVRIGDTFTVRLPSGEERDGNRLLSPRRCVVRHAARCEPHQARHQTFETRLRVDNKDRRLAVGMTVYVLPLAVQ